MWVHGRDDLPIEAALLRAALVVGIIVVAATGTAAATLYAYDVKEETDADLLWNRNEAYIFVNILNRWPRVATPFDVALRGQTLTLTGHNNDQEMWRAIDVQRPGQPPERVWYVNQRPRR